MVGKGRAFAAAARFTRQAKRHTRVDSRADIREIRIVGGWACNWNQLTVTLTPVGGERRPSWAGPASCVVSI